MRGGAQILAVTRPALLVALAVAMPPLAVRAQTGGDKAAMAELERSFRLFLADFRQRIHRHDANYVKTVHPRLPAEMYDFFFDVTLQMMRHSEETGQEPAVECQEYKVCKAVYTQPGGSWAAQSFILYEGAWRWLAE